MTDHDDFDRSVRDWMDRQADPGAPPGLAREVGDATRGMRQHQNLVPSFLGQWAGRSVRLAIGTALVVAIVLAVAFVVPKTQPGLVGPLASPSEGPPAGFAEVTYRLFSAVGGKAPDAEAVAATVAIIKARAQAAGMTGVTVAPQGANEIVVTMLVANSDAAARFLGTTGRIEFVPLPPAKYGTAITNPAGPTGVTENEPLPDDPSLVPLFDGSSITSASVVTDQNGQPVVEFSLSPAASAAFATYTTNNVGDFFAIVLDGTVISAPSIQSPIPDGHGEITIGAGPGAQDAARDLAAVLKAGPLPFPLVLVEGTTGASPIPDPSPG